MKTLKGFIKKELIALWRDPTLIVAILVLPIIQILIIGEAITVEAKNIKLVVDAEPNDFVMERIYDHAIASGWFIKVRPMEKDTMDVVSQGKADVAIVAPEGGLLRSMARGEGNIQILIDATNVIQAQSVDGYLRGIITQVLRDEKFGIKSELPIQFTVRLMFNPELSTQWFFVPAMIVIQVFMTILLLTTVSMTREKENGTIETLISAPISKYDIILGKTIPAIIMAFFNMILVLSAGLILFKLPFVGSLVMFVLAFLMFCVPACAIGIWLSTYTNTQQQAMLGMMMVAFLAMMLSGTIFPSENMPDVLQWISYVNPLTHYTYMIRNIILKGAGWAYFMAHSAVLVTSGIVVAFFAIRRFKTKLV